MEGEVPASELGLQAEKTPTEGKVDSIRNPNLPPPEEKYFKREEDLPFQEKFSSKVKDMVLVPIRAELINGNLAKFLNQLNQQNGLEGKKIGITFLVNDNAADLKEKPEVVQENKKIVDLLTNISSKNLDAISLMEIPQEYKDIASQILEKDQLEVRFDYLHSNQAVPRFGALRAHLFDMARNLRNSDVPEDSMVVHLSDIDIYYANSHFNELSKFYEDSSHLFNFSEQDFVPGYHEGAIGDENITRDLLEYFDQFRFYRYGMDVLSMLGGRMQFGTPTMSGRLSLFSNNPAIENELSLFGSGEDYEIAGRVRKINGGDISIGNTSEVYRDHRARTGKENGFRRTDADEAYDVVKNKNFKIFDMDTLYNPEEYIEIVEKLIMDAVSKNQINSHASGFKNSEEFRKLLQRELNLEKAKVILRRKRAIDYLDSLSGNQSLPPESLRLIAPFDDFFQDEKGKLKQMIATGMTNEQIAVYLFSKYKDFFGNSDIHTQIARLRTLKKYVLGHNLVNKEGYSKIQKEYYERLNKQKEDEYFAREKLNQESSDA